VFRVQGQQFDYCGIELHGGLEQLLAQGREHVWKVMGVESNGGGMIVRTLV
jgi:hypothetical protein